MIPSDAIVALKLLGSDLAAARKSRRMTQANLAARVGVSRNLISRMETGDHRVSIGVIMTSAWILGLEQNLANALHPQTDLGFIKNARLSLPERVRSERPPSEDPELDF